MAEVYRRIWWLVFLLDVWTVDVFAVVLDTVLVSSRALTSAELPSWPTAVTADGHHRTLVASLPEGVGYAARHWISLIGTSL